MVPVIRDAGRLTLRRVPRRLQRARRQGADQHADRRRPRRRQRHAHQPRRHRHDRVGAAADGGPGHDRRHRLDRLSGRASGGSAQMIGAEKVMTMTSTYDHRIIQGAESGRFLQRIEALPAGRGWLLRARVRRSRRRAAGASAPPAPAARRGRRRARRRPGRRAGDGARRGAAAGSAGRHLAAQGPPHPRPPRGSAGPARPRARGRPGARPRAAGPDPRADGQDPGADPAHVRRPATTLADALPHLRETYCGPIAYEIEHIASHRQRLWLREAIESGAFRQPLTNDEQKALLRAADRGRRARALHAQGLPRARSSSRSRAST